MITPQLIAGWRRDEAAPFEGWDFSYIDGRCDEDQPSWDYVALARAAIAKASSVLDMQTGGGEIFASLAPFPGRTYAVESYAPNVAVARRRLECLGVEVRARPESKRLPFDDEFFDLVLNRHGGLRLADIARVLKIGGTFLTQQVDGRSLSDLQACFGAKPKWPESTLDNMRAQAEGLGLRIVRGEAWEGRTSFRDVGALVYFLKAIPWLVEGFSVETHFENLKALQNKIDREGRLSFACQRYLLIAQKS